MPHISVVLANYNGEKFLAETLDTVAAQTHRDFEVILVDDGSTDGSRVILEHFSEAYPDQVRLFLRPKNEGQGPAFNFGVEQAQGDLVAFLDSDDLWLPHKLERLAAMRAAQPDAVLYQHNLRLHVDGQPTERLYRELMLNGDVFGYTKRNRVFPLFTPTSGLAFPRAILQRVMPIPAGFRTCADGYLTRTSMVFGRVAATDEWLGYYRRHGGNHVLGNTAHDAMRYRTQLLIPALNAFYRKNKIRFEFPVPPLWKEVLKGRVKQVVDRIKT